MATSPGYGGESTVDLTELSLEELMNVEVTSVSKKAEKASEATAAIFVITPEDIRRSGATCVPEVLRMVPGIQVARITSNKWAITSRGFNDRYTSKMLVLVDGRSVYSPLFSDIEWDVQDFLLEDIERIEVIRGPGATLWGANAVNGVINILTKQAKATQGGLVTSGGGSEERGFGAVRYGGKLSDGTFYRLYAKYFNRDKAVYQSGHDADDPWQAWKTGFRLDRENTNNSLFTIQGDFFDSRIDEEMTLLSPNVSSSAILKETVKASGSYLLGRWTKHVSGTSTVTLQSYCEWARREFENLTDENRNTFDIDFQHQFSFLHRHDFIWGLEYRLTDDDLEGSETIFLDPSRRNLQVFSGFLQDEVELLKNRLRVTLGSKVEHNDYTGFELQPNARLLWTPNEKNSLWLAVSRAVRTPARAENEAQINLVSLPPGDPWNPTLLPIIATLYGSSHYRSEELIAYEIGYRPKLRDRLTVDIAAFYNDYRQLRAGKIGAPFLSATPPPLHLVLPAIVNNQTRGETYGIELTVDCVPVPWWRLQLSYSFLRMQLHTLIAKDNAFGDFLADQLERDEGRSPRHQLSLRSLIDLPRNFELDLWLRYVDNLPGFVDVKVGSYLTLDIRLGWRPSERVEVSIVGQNVLDDRHPEFGIPFFIHGAPTEVERGVYGKITWRFW